MPQIQLSDFQQAVDKRYGDFEVFVTEDQVLRFAPALRLAKTKRTELAAALNINARAEIDNGDDIFDVYRDVFRISARKPEDFDTLAGIFQEDPALWQELFHAYTQDTAAGEA